MPRADYRTCLRKPQANRPTPMRRKVKYREHPPPFTLRGDQKLVLQIYAFFERYTSSGVYLFIQKKNSSPYSKNIKIAEKFDAPVFLAATL